METSKHDLWSLIQLEEGSLIPCGRYYWQQPRSSGVKFSSRHEPLHAECSQPPAEGLYQKTRLGVKRATEPELVVLDKRAKIKSGGYLTVMACVRSWGTAGLRGEEPLREKAAPREMRRFNVKPNDWDLPWNKENRAAGWTKYLSRLDVFICSARPVLPPAPYWYCSRIEKLTLYRNTTGLYNSIATEIQETAMWLGGNI